MPKHPIDEVTDADDGDEADAYSIKRFCRRHSISEAFFHKLRGLGLAPAVMQVGSKVLISREAAKRWRNQKTTASKRSTASATAA